MVAIEFRLVPILLALMSSAALIYTTAIDGWDIFLLLDTESSLCGWNLTLTKYDKTGIYKEMASLRNYDSEAKCVCGGGGSPAWKWESRSINVKERHSSHNHSSHLQIQNPNKFDLHNQPWLTQIQKAFATFTTMSAIQPTGTEAQI